MPLPLDIFRDVSSTPSAESTQLQLLTMMQAAHLIQACTCALICFNYKGQPFQLSKLHLTIVRLPTRSSKQTNLNNNSMYMAKAARAKF